MSTTNYSPREGSVAFKVIAFLRANPQETLDADIISAKFDCVRNNVHTLLGPAVQAGVIVRSEDKESGDLVYSAGRSGFHAWLEKQAQKEGANRPKVLPPPADVKTPRRQRSKAFRIDLDTLVIEKGIPLPSHKSAVVDWMPMLNKLDVGDSFLLPSGARSAIGSVSTKFKKATGKALTVRVLSEGVRVWRVE